MLHNFLNPLKQAVTASGSPQPTIPLVEGPPSPALATTSLDSQLDFAWESLSPAQVAAISDCFKTHVGWSQAKHMLGLTLAYTTLEIPEPVHPEDSYKPHWSTTTLLLLRNFAEVGGQWSQPVFAADWPGKIPPIDLPTAIKQLQEEDVCSPHEGHTSSTQLA